MMPHKYRNIVRAFYSNEWAILPEKLEDIREFLAARSAGAVWTPEEIQARIGERPTPFEAPQGSQVAVLNLFGVLSQRMNALDQTSGGTSLEQFGQAFDESIQNDDVKAVILNISSPGGQVFGTEELSDRIFQARGEKPIVSVINSMATSAAFWIASQADEIIAAPSSWLGSIGVLTIHTDDTGMQEKLGIKETTITAGKFKAENVGELTEGGRAAIQEKLDSVLVKFVASVARGRDVSAETVASRFGQGRVVHAEKAVKLGMADRIGTLQQVLSEFGVSSSPSGDATTAPAFQMKGFSKMNDLVFGALVHAGMCKINASEAEAEKALGRFFAVRSMTPPDTDEAKLAALQAFTDELMAAGNTPGGLLTPAGIVPILQAPAASVTTTPPVPVASLGMAAQDIIAAVSISGLSDADKLDMQSSLLSKPMQTADVMKAIQDKAAESAPAQGAGQIAFGESSLDKMAAEARDALLCRQYGTSNLPAEVFDKPSDEMVAFSPSKTARRGGGGLASLPKLVANCFIECGYDTRRVLNASNADLCRAMFNQDPSSVLGFRAASDGPAFNVSGLFSNILLDASNVVLRRSYIEAPNTYTRWMKQGPSVPDFKIVNKVIAGELADVKAVPEDGEFDEFTMGDEKETYRLVVWGGIWSQSWQSVVNDQLGSFTEQAAKQGTALRRKQNKLAYGILKDNPTMADTGAVFNATAVTTTGGHANLITSGAAPSVATLNAAYTSMSIQPGLEKSSASTRTTLGLEPKFIISGTNLRGTILELLSSTANPASSGNSGITNIWQNGLEPVFDAQLNTALGGVDAQWWLAADTAVIDTIEYAFLQGLETPAFDQEVAFTSLAIRQRIYQAFIVKAIDWRGLFTNDGVT